MKTASALERKERGKSHSVDLESFRMSPVSPRKVVRPTLNPSLSRSSLGPPSVSTTARSSLELPLEIQSINDNAAVETSETRRDSTPPKPSDDITPAVSLEPHINVSGISNASSLDATPASVSRRDSGYASPAVICYVKNKRITELSKRASGLSVSSFCQSDKNEEEEDGVKLSEVNIAIQDTCSDLDVISLPASISPSFENNEIPEKNNTTDSCEPADLITNSIRTENTQSDHCGSGDAVTISSIGPKVTTENTQPATEQQYRNISPLEANPLRRLRLTVSDPLQPASLCKQPITATLSATPHGK